MASSSVDVTPHFEWRLAIVSCFRSIALPNSYGSRIANTHYSNLGRKMINHPFALLLLL